MNRYLMTNIFFTLLFLLGSANGDVIYTAINPDNGHEYHLLETKDWTDSQAEAESLGGNLVTINDQSEQDWVYQTFGNIDGIARSLWIGFYESEPGTGNYVWVNGEPVIYTNWWPGQPDNYGNIENYVQIMSINSAEASYWNDAPNFSAHVGLPISYGVVEVSSNIPEPSVFGLLCIGFLGLGFVKTMPGLRKNI